MGAIYCTYWLGTVGSIRPLDLFQLHMSTTVPDHVQPARPALHQRAFLLSVGGDLWTRILQCRSDPLNEIYFFSF